MTFLVIALGSLTGTLLGNLGLFWIIGTMAKRQEKLNQERLQELQRGYLEMVQKETERMRNYAEMEG